MAVQCTTVTLPLSCKHSFTNIDDLRSNVRPGSTYPSSFIIHDVFSSMTSGLRWRQLSAASKRVHSSSATAASSGSYQPSTDCLTRLASSRLYQTIVMLRANCDKCPFEPPVNDASKRPLSNGLPFRSGFVGCNEYNAASSPSQPLISPYKVYAFLSSKLARFLKALRVDARAVMTGSRGQPCRFEWRTIRLTTTGLHADYTFPLPTPSPSSRPGGRRPAFCKR